MTIAIAQRRGDEILLLADTKITNEVATRPDELPGQLKLITFAQRMTTAFAGNAGAAFVVTRDARWAFRRDGLAAALEVLIASSRESDTDYVVAAHHGGTGLWRISKGGRLRSQDVCAIGVQEPFKEMIERARASSESLWNGHLRSEFINTLMTGLHGEASVGGFPIAVNNQAITRSD